MSIKEDEVKDGDILVGHNLLITPAILLEKKKKLDEGNLLIHDRVITLRAEIPPSLLSSSLYQYLADRHILYELDFEYEKFGQEEIYELADLFGEAFSKEELNDVLGTRRLRDYIYQEYTDGNYNEYVVNNPGGEEERAMSIKRNMIVDEIIRTHAGGTAKVSERAEDKDLRLHQLRTAAYWEISGQLSLAFLPDFMRIPIISGYNDRIRQSLRTLIQSKVAVFFWYFKQTLYVKNH
jgi:hypothetical protein